MLLYKSVSCSTLFRFNVLLIVESLRLRLTFWAGESVRKREVFEVEVELLGVFGAGARTAGVGGRGLCILVALVTLEVVVVGVGTKADLVVLPVLTVGVCLVALAVGAGVGVPGSGVVGDVKRVLSLEDLVIMRDTKVLDWS